VAGVITLSARSFPVPNGLMAVRKDLHQVGGDQVEGLSTCQIVSMRPKTVHWPHALFSPKRSTSASSRIIGDIYYE
jgi:hypothetical protein